MAGVGGSLVAEQIRIVSLLARGAMFAPFRAVAMLRVRAPERLLIAPQDIRTTDPTMAGDIYAGWFSLAGRTINMHGHSPFDVVPPSAAWQDELESFVWLRHLRAADTALSRINARAFIVDWMGLRSKSRGHTAWRADITARRLICWLSQSPLILDGADAAFYRRFMKCIGRHGAVLQNYLRAGVQGEARLLVCIALVELALCAQGLGKLEKQATRSLTEELKRQILPDGGHIGRNPQVLVDLLLDLLPLRRAYAARGLAPPDALLNTIDRMMPMLRLFRHSNGSLALFNGMGRSEADALATVLAYDDARASPLENAPASGYQRVAFGASVLVMDSGKPPQAEFSRTAHAGTLAIEFSCGGQLLLVNCGAPDAERTLLREASRLTAAHSTLVINDVSSSRFGPQRKDTERGAGPGPAIVAGPTNIKLARETDARGVKIAASHDGYVKRFGVIHERRVRLSPDGAVLKGEDLLIPTGKTTPALHFVVRFHLVPSAEVEVLPDGSAALVTLADGQNWLMTTEGLAISAEDSAFFAAPEGPRASRQLVIAADAATATRVAWRFALQAE